MSAQALTPTDEKRELKAYVRCTGDELKAWRKKFGRGAVGVARAALLSLSIASAAPSPFRDRRLLQVELNAVLTIRVTEGELWLIQTRFPCFGQKGKAGRMRYAPFIRLYMNKASGFKAE